MKNILIPTDFSENAYNAIKYAIHLFEQEKCTFHFLHTYTPTAYAYDFNAGTGLISVESLKNEIDLVYQDSQDKLRRLLERIIENYPNDIHEFNTISAYNILTDEINTQIEERNIDLVIMGTQGATGAQEVLFGSNTLYVMRKAICPVLAIPESFHFKYIDNVLFPSDYKHTYTKKDVQSIIELAALNEATVHTLHISNEIELSKVQRENRDKINEYFRNIKHDFKEVADEDVPDAIAHYISNNHIELLAMTRRKHSFLERLLFKQNIKVIGLHIKIPFLVIPVN